MALKKGYFAPLVTLPSVITEAGTYVTRKGEYVTIERVSKRHDFKCQGYYPDGTIEDWHKSGRLYASTTCDNDIVAKA